MPGHGDPDARPPGIPSQNEAGRIRLPGGLAPVEPGELLVIVGETASGKTRLAVELSRAFDGEIVGADSVQVYRGFDVGSGKPTEEELAGVRHHLIDVAEPGEDFDAARFVELADAAIADVRARGRTPIVCGGTYLWVRALLHGLASAPRAPKELRAKLQADAERLGAPALHARLAAMDPTSAARLHPNDAVRIVRALEVFETTGRPLSEWQREHGFRPERYRARQVAIAHPRAELEARIERRVHDMLARGWIDEVRALLARGHGASRAMAAVGYAEVKAHLEGATAEADLAKTITRATRIFARRQRTWLAKAPVEWISASAP
ncbi:MAG: tRNA (adenosine(37)-N6)-dimethylallyltransferase MiaA [Deltaproteobacteria bacterium]|nr:tRNA (adenosine(37)-N6)-dimethylallyltransferase MiaA [Deltaproteobacteria bacterium]